MCEKTASRGKTPAFRREEDDGSHIQPWPGTAACATGNSRPLLLVGRGMAACTSSDGGGAGPSGGQSPDPVVWIFSDRLRGSGRCRQHRDVTRRARAACRSSRARIFTCATVPLSSAERNLTAEITRGMGDVRDVEPVVRRNANSCSRCVSQTSSARAPEDQPTGTIWEYDLDLQQAGRVIASDTTADDGQDVAPHYLPTAASSFRRPGNGSPRPSCSRKQATVRGAGRERR